MRAARRSEPHRPRKRPIQERSQRTVDAILEAAAQVFTRRGYAGTTTNHIAERAGVSEMQHAAPVLEAGDAHFRARRFACEFQHAVAGKVGAETAVVGPSRANGTMRTAWSVRSRIASVRSTSSASSR